MTGVLDILNKKKQSYSVLFRKTGVAHETLQKALKFLVERDLIEKGYKITNKGKSFSKKLKDLKKFV